MIVRPTRMYSSALFSPFLRATLLLGVIACQQPHSATEIEAAMKHYDQLIKTVNADSMAMLYTPDGNLGNIAYGQDSIRRFLARFKDVKVLSMASTTTSIEMKGDSSIQKGTYRQVAVLPKQDTVHVKGEYTANWQWEAANGWRIKRMLTKPTP